MPKAARVNDLWSGICCCHIMPTCISMVGYIVTGSPDSKSNNLGNARIGDVTIGSCGHTGLIVSGSSTCKSNNLGKARIGSYVSGCNIGIVITGSPDHEIGG